MVKKENGEYESVVQEDNDEHESFAQVEKNDEYEYGREPYQALSEYIQEYMETSTTLLRLVDSETLNPQQPSADRLFMSRIDYVIF